MTNAATPTTPSAANPKNPFNETDAAMTAITPTIDTPPTDVIETTAIAPTDQSAATGAARSKPKVRFDRVVRGEWIKFWSVRSTWATLLGAAAVTVIFGMIFSAVAGSDSETAGPAAFLTDPVDVALGGIGLTEMLIGVLGVMVVAGEYSTGLIRTSFAAVGRRARTIQAKVAVVASTVFVTGAAAVTAAIVAGQAVYGGDLPTVPVSEVLDVILGTTVYLTGVALIGVALGFILRSTAAGIGTLVGGVFIGPNLLQLLPDSITDVFLKYLPSEAGSAMMTRVADPDLLSTGAAYAVFAAWVVGLLTVAGILVRRRDA
ncbi:MAG: ABC transporter permease [Actinomycetota bacterium]